MVYKIRTGVPWRDLPERYGSWKTVYTRFRRYAINGVFTQALQQIQAQTDAASDIDWLVQIDSVIVRAHQHAAATGRKGGPTGRTNQTNAAATSSKATEASQPATRRPPPPTNLWSPSHRSCSGLDQFEDEP